MKDKIILTAFLSILMIVVPFFLVKAEPQPQEPPSIKENKAVDSKIIFNVYNCDTDEVMELDGQDYMISVVAGEMPASYEAEALKAQAVAAFTYAYRRKISNSVDEKHVGAELCTDSSHCKAFADRDEMKEKWGKEYDKYFEKIKAAVEEVYGEIMTYKDKPIDAVFHAISSGKTEAAEDVWGNEVPYLAAADSSYDERAEGYLTQVRISRKEFVRLMEEFNEEADFDEEEEEWLDNITRSDSGGIITAELCSIPVSGRNMRNIFGLRSTNFELSYDDGEFTFNVKGYGHGVGMSQYGANCLAEQGYDHREILSHYYNDIDFASAI